ncbi:hypothetical protein [Desulfohalovibrio reitneri]|uniref:hypothetical protein n=1 Tax=Desulfohalovibrio reitneri TaxID=1307759 RepID=UPI00068EA863|nr:hypothetical protein [Desulfohalovibrio reitneri]
MSSEKNTGPETWDGEAAPENGEQPPAEEPRDEAEGSPGEGAEGDRDEEVPADSHASEDEPDEPAHLLVGVGASAGGWRRSRPCWAP